MLTWKTQCQGSAVGPGRFLGDWLRQTVNFLFPRRQHTHSCMTPVQPALPGWLITRFSRVSGEQLLPQKTCPDFVLASVTSHMGHCPLKVTLLPPFPPHASVSSPARSLSPAGFVLCPLHEDLLNVNPSPLPRSFLIYPPLLLFHVLY